MARDSREDEFAHYSGGARFYHWLTALIILVMVGTGLAMVFRAKDLNLWDGTTNFLYATHKSLGLVLLTVVILRLAYRMINGAPTDEPTLEFFHRVMSHATHWALYGLLLVLPLLGWIGISLFPALDVFGFKIPAIAAPDQGLAKQVLWIHGLAAYCLIVLVGMHVGAALYHHIVRRDDVLRRMLPGLKRRA